MPSVTGSKSRCGSSVQSGPGPHTCPCRAPSLRGCGRWQLSCPQPGSAETGGAEDHPKPSTKSTPGQRPSCTDTAAVSQIISTTSFWHSPPCSGSVLTPYHLPLLFIAWQEIGTPQPCHQLPSPVSMSHSRTGHSTGHHRVKNTFNGHVCFGLNPRALVTRQLGAPKAHMAPELPGWGAQGQPEPQGPARGAAAWGGPAPAPCAPHPVPGLRAGTAMKLHPWERHQLAALVGLSSLAPCRAGAQQREFLILH